MSRRMSKAIERWDELSKSWESAVLMYASDEMMNARESYARPYIYLNPLSALRMRMRE